MQLEEGAPELVQVLGVLCRYEVEVEGERRGPVEHRRCATDEDHPHAVPVEDTEDQLDVERTLLSQLGGRSPEPGSPLLRTATGPRA